METGHPACRGCAGGCAGDPLTPESEKEEEQELLLTLLRFMFKYSGELHNIISFRID